MAALRGPESVAAGIALRGLVEGLGVRVEHVGNHAARASHVADGQIEPDAQVLSVKEGGRNNGWVQLRCAGELVEGAREISASHARQRETETNVDLPNAGLRENGLVERGCVAETVLLEEQRGDVEAGFLER